MILLEAWISEIILYKSIEYREERAAQRDAILHIFCASAHFSVQLQAKKLDTNFATTFAAFSM